METETMVLYAADLCVSLARVQEHCGKLEWAQASVSAGRRCGAEIRLARRNRNCAEVCHVDIPAYE